MRPFIRISLASWIKLQIPKGVALATLLFVLPACQNRAPSLRMLDHRAGYDDLDEHEVGLYQKRKGGFNSLQGSTVSNGVFRKSAPKVSRVYIYPHELPTKDYFWGGYVSLVVTPDEWIVEPEESNWRTIQSTEVAQPLTAPILSSQASQDGLPEKGDPQ